MPMCSRCNLSFSPAMHFWHLRADHKMAYCKLCKAPIFRFGWTLTRFAKPDFCSARCKGLVRRRGLCRECVKEPDGTFIWGYCSKCWPKFASVFHGQREIAGQLAAIKRATYLPKAYQRRGRGDMRMRFPA